VSTDDYLHRLVDAILGTPGVARRIVRDDYLEVLTRLVGETPQMNRSDDPERDIAAMVAWCADHPSWCATAS
jgi:hypothetical protein